MAELKLLSSHKETGNIHTFVFETGGLSWQPGQYQKYVLARAGTDKKDNQRYFTIASAPSENEIHISTRVTQSIFKQALHSLQPGESIEAFGAKGDFVWDDDSEVVLIAGGIGVTPYRSMLIERHLRGMPLNAIMLHYNRDSQMAFREEFEALVVQHPELELRYVEGKPITVDSILELAPEANGQTVYLSGPEPMVESVGDALKSRGIDVKQDWFPGYTDETM